MNIIVKAELTFKAIIELIDYPSFNKRDHVCNTSGMEIQKYCYLHTKQIKISSFNLGMLHYQPINVPIAGAQAFLMD
jgi:hypothetical protein